LRPDDTFQTFVQDMVRGETLRSLPFFNQSAVVALLDKLPHMDVGARTAFDQLLMHIVSLCVLQQRFGLSGSAICEADEVGASGD